MPLGASELVVPASKLHHLPYSKSVNKHTADDIATASILYGEEQRATDGDYRLQTGKIAGKKRWVERD